MNLIEVAIQAAQIAGEEIKKGFKKKSHVLYKDKHNIVTKTDKASEKALLEVLQGVFPSHSFFSEEVGLIQGVSDCLWVIDPLDGTTNFSKKFPHCCVSIGFYYCNMPSVAVVYNPIQNELFTAEAGGGAYLNGRKISVTASCELEKSVIMLNRGSTHEEKMRSGKIFMSLMQYVRSIRILGATALDLCYVACGRFDALVNNGCEHYDCAAGNLIAIEAGASVTDFYGAPWKLQKSDLLVAHPVLHERIVALFLANE